MAANLPGTYMAWLASDTLGPADRFTNSAKNAAGYFLVNGSRIATSWADLLDGKLLIPIGLAEDGGLVTEAVWSNVAHDGGVRASGESCMNWTSAAALTVGGAGQSGGDPGAVWTARGSDPCDRTYRIYCFEQ